MQSLPGLIISNESATRHYAWIHINGADHVAHEFMQEILQLIKTRLPSNVISIKAAIHFQYNDHCLTNHSSQHVLRNAHRKMKKQPRNVAAELLQAFHILKTIAEKSPLCIYNHMFLYNLKPHLCFSFFFVNFKN